MAETEEVPVPTHDDAIYGLCKTLINAIVKESEGAHGVTPKERLKNEIQHRTRPEMVGAIEAFSTYLLAKATDRQAAAMETVARSASAMATVERVDDTAQAMVDMREPKRDYLATTYRLAFDELVLLWAMRGMVMDAAIRSLSKPERFDPYLKVTTEEIAWSLRMTSENLWQMLPRRPNGEIDYGLLEDFDLTHYDGTADEPDGWMYGG